MMAQSHKLDLALTGGYVQDGFGGMATLDYKVNEFDFIQLNVHANFTNKDVEGVNVPVDLYSFNAGFFFDILRNNARTFALSIGAGGTVGQEIINGNDENLSSGQILGIETNTIVFGAYAGIDADIFLIPTIAINVKINEIYHANSEIGSLSPYAGLGIKLILK